MKNSLSLLELEEVDTKEVISIFNELEEIDKELFMELEKSFQNQFARIIFLKSFAMLKSDFNILKFSLYNAIARQIIFSQKEYKGEWKEKNLSHIIFNSCNFIDIHFVEMNFTDVIFYRCVFYNCIFEDVIFSGCVFCESTQNIFFINVQFITPSNYMYKFGKKISLKRIEPLFRYCYNFITCRIEEGALIIDSDAVQSNSFCIKPSKFLTINSILMQDSRFKRNFYEFYYSKKLVSPLLLSANKQSRNFFLRFLEKSYEYNEQSPYYIKSNKIKLFS